MILNELQLLDRLLREEWEERIVVTPLIDPRRQFGPASIDLRLGYGFKVVKDTRYTHLEVLGSTEDLQKQVQRYTDEFHVEPLEAVVIHPGQFVLGSTLEFVRLPSDITGRLEGRSSWGRLGLEIHATAGFIDPGFSGNLTFELKNVGPVPITVYSGLRVAQLTFHAGEHSHLPYSYKTERKYAHGLGTVGSLLYKDSEFGRIRYLSELRKKCEKLEAELSDMQSKGTQTRGNVSQLRDELSKSRKELQSYGV